MLSRASRRKRVVSAIPPLVVSNDTKRPQVGVSSQAAPSAALRQVVQCFPREASRCCGCPIVKKIPFPRDGVFRRCLLQGRSSRFEQIFTKIQAHRPRTPFSIPRIHYRIKGSVVYGCYVVDFVVLELL